MSDICVCSHHSSIAALLADPEFRAQAHRPGFLVELRLDAYRDLSHKTLAAALQAFGPEVVVTFRHPAEGGLRPGVADAERLEYLNAAAVSGARYLDVEARTSRETLRKGGSSLILSYHNFAAVPEWNTLQRQWAEMAAAPEADVIKIACAPKTAQDSAPLLQLLQTAQAARRPAIVLGMGAAGFWTRVAGALFDTPLTYARGAGAPGTAPGQPVWRELEELYRFRAIRPGWPVYAVIGCPVGHSLSPVLHNTALRELELPGVYLPFEVQGDPVAFVKAFASLGLEGISVTIPHKEAVPALCAEIDPVAQAIGAVNTLTHRPDGTWSGTNTDASAAADSLAEALGELRGRNVLLLGAGGAARAVTFGLVQRGANVFIFNRTLARAAALAAAAGAQVLSREELSGLAGGHGRTGGKPICFDAVVNTTSLGMYPHVEASPLEAHEIPEGSVVFDTVYNPLKTRLLELAAGRNCRTLEGIAMFIGQGVRQFELWTGRPAPRAAVTQAVRAALLARQTPVSTSAAERLR